MGILNRFGKGAAHRLTGMVAMWKPPKSSGGTNISTVEAIYAGCVLILMFMVLGALKGDGLGSALVLGATLVALSNAIRRIVIPAIYPLFAQVFRWPSFENALKQEDVARGGSPISVPDQSPAVNIASAPPTSSPAVGATPVPSVDEDILKALRLFIGLVPSERRSRALKMLEFLKQKGENSPVMAVVDTSEDLNERAQLAEAALLTLAKQKLVA